MQKSWAVGNLQPDGMNSVAIIGAGPIGLELALALRSAGFGVKVYEKGSIAENLRRWGNVRLFSPFGMNASLLGKLQLADENSIGSLPDDQDLLTGNEFVQRYLGPLSRLSMLEGCIVERTTVVAVSRWSARKGELIGNKARATEPFRLLVECDDCERYEWADFVVDCSGTYPHHRWLGAGGLPVPGERTHLTAANYELPDVTGRERQSYLGQKTLVVGSGYSAATVVAGLAELANENHATQVTWITRDASAVEPMQRIPHDALPERDRLAIKANELARSEFVLWMPGCDIVRIDGRKNDTGFYVNVEKRDSAGTIRKSLEVDRVVALVGYRPDRAIYEELQVHECYASQGPMKLAAALLGDATNDCLAQTSKGGETLRNPESGFFILGSKSYGRDSRFLLQVGLEQIDDLLQLLMEERGSVSPTDQTAALKNRETEGLT